MQRMMCIATGFLVTLMTTLTVQADDHMQVPAYGGVEVFGCDFAEGKDMDDLLDVSKRWDTWASENNSQPYSGYLLQPYYYDDLDDEIYWVGFSPSLAAQGIVQAEWLAKGGELQQEFDSVIPCKSHGQLAWVRVVDEDESPSSQGIVDFAGCAMLPGGSQEKLAAADAKMNAFNAKIGNSARIYRWYPIQGYSCTNKEFYNMVDHHIIFYTLLFQQVSSHRQCKNNNQYRIVLGHLLLETQGIYLAGYECNNNYLHIHLQGSILTFYY